MIPPKGFVVCDAKEFLEATKGLEGVPVETEAPFPLSIPMSVMQFIFPDGSLAAQAIYRKGRYPPLYQRRLAPGEKHEISDEARAALVESVTVLLAEMGNLQDRIDELNKQRDQRGKEVEEAMIILYPVGAPVLVRMKYPTDWVPGVVVELMSFGLIKVRLLSTGEELYYGVRSLRRRKEGE